MIFHDNSSSTLVQRDSEHRQLRAFAPRDFYLVTGYNHGPFFMAWQGESWLCTTLVYLPMTSARILGNMLESCIMENHWVGPGLEPGMLLVNDLLSTSCQRRYHLGHGGPLNLCVEVIQNSGIFCLKILRTTIIGSFGFIRNSSEWNRIK